MTETGSPQGGRREGCAQRLTEHRPLTEHRLGPSRSHGSSTVSRSLQLRVGSTHRRHRLPDAIAQTWLPIAVAAIGRRAPRMEARSWV